MSLEAILCTATGATSATRLHRIQELWSGWGEIVRYRLDGVVPDTVIVKRVSTPTEASHPVGWSSSHADQRKERSYRVEHSFYRDLAPRLSGAVRVPRALHLEPGLFVLEDLDAVGFAGRARGAGSLDIGRVHPCLDWLAGLHATFLGAELPGVWEFGTYWHLATRPDELLAMAPGALREAAAAIDAALSGASHQTLVHGDAKVANFCFGPDRVAAVDFQYTGGGCGLKDVAYFLGSCLHDRVLERDGEALLDRYFQHLRAALGDELGAAVEGEWRPLWPMAWADFERFLAGWAPNHWKRTGYAADMTRLALRGL